MCEWVSVCVCLSACESGSGGGGGGGGGGIWWPEQFSSMPGVSKSNMFRTCVQRKQKFFKCSQPDMTPHTQTFFFFKQQSCTYLAGTSVSRACCRILHFCLACLLQNSALLSRVPTAEFCASVLRACCRIVRKPNRFIQSFLLERSFRVRVGSTLSELHKQEMGVPQSSILSPALLSIKINNIVKAVLKGTYCSLFVDDFAMCVSGKTLNRVERAVQLCVNSVQKWVSENGFKFSTSKMVCIHFHQQSVFFPRP